MTPARGAYAADDFSCHCGRGSGSFLPCDDPAASPHQTIEPPSEPLAHEFCRGNCRVPDRIRAVHRAAQRAGIHRVRNEWRCISGIGGGKRYPALCRQAWYVWCVRRTYAARHRTWTCHRHRIARRFNDCETSRPATPDAYIRASHRCGSRRWGGRNDPLPQRMSGSGKGVIARLNSRRFNQQLAHVAARSPTTRHRCVLLRQAAALAAAQSPAATAPG